MRFIFFFKKKKPFFKAVVAFLPLKEKGLLGISPF